MWKKYLPLVGLAIVCVVVFILIKDRQVSKPEDGQNQQQASGNVPQATPEEETQTPATGSSLAYSEALKKYEGKRIQLDPNCKAIPSEATYKNGTAIMIDNRSNEPRKVTFNLKTYNIAAYGYQIVTASNPTLPATTFIDCGTSQNVAKILIQK